MARAPAVTIALKELREILRDRRTLVLAFVVPLLIHPFLFFGMGRVEEMREAKAAHTVSRIGVETASDAVRSLLGGNPDLDVVAAPPDWRLLEEKVLHALVVEDSRPLAADRDPSAIAFTVYLLGGDPDTRRARHRITTMLASANDTLLKERFHARGVEIDPRALVTATPIDVSAPSETTGGFLGRVLPVMLVLLLLTGGSFAALDVVAGEKERRTLETLYTQPVPTVSIVHGKFAAVLLVSLAAVACNLTGMGIAAGLGFVPQGVPQGIGALPGLLSIGATLALTAPLAVLTSAVLLAVSTFARTFRQAEVFLLPLSLAAAVPALLGAMPDVRLSPALAIVPIAGPAIAMREVLLGEFSPGYLAAVFGSTALYGALAMRWCARLLEREDLRLDLTPPSLLEGNSQSRARRAVAFGAFMLLVMNYFAPLLQNPDGPLGVHGGLAATLWGLVLVPAILYLRLFRLPRLATLGLRRPPAGSLAVSVALVPPAVLLMAAYMLFQNAVLPFPSGLEREFEKVLFSDVLGFPGMLFLIALSPGICEEILWRGVVQGELEGERRPLKTVIVVGLFFGLFHLSVHRLVPTALLGFLLAYLRYASGSILPCMLFHTLYNGSMLLIGRLLGPERLEAFIAPAPILFCVVLVAALVRALAGRPIGRSVVDATRL